MYFTYQAPATFYGLYSAALLAFDASELEPEMRENLELTRSCQPVVAFTEAQPQNSSGCSSRGLL